MFGVDPFVYADTMDGMKARQEVSDLIERAHEYGINPSERIPKELWPEFIRKFPSVDRVVLGETGIFVHTGRFGKTKVDGAYIHKESAPALPLPQFGSAQTTELQPGVYWYYGTDPSQPIAK